MLWLALNPDFSAPLQVADLSFEKLDSGFPLLEDPCSSTAPFPPLLVVLLSLVIPSVFVLRVLSFYLHIFSQYLIYSYGFLRAYTMLICYTTARSHHFSFFSI